MSTPKALETCVSALKRMQEFDPASLSRDADLGKQLNFAPAVKPAEDIVSIYKRIPISVAEDFTDNQLALIAGQAQADFQLFSQLLEFNPSAGDAGGTRNALLVSIKARRDQLFEQVWQYMAYGVARVTDTGVLETQARTTIQAIKDEAAALTLQLGEDKKAADTALAAIRAVASEQGVSQQAIHFKNEAADQEDLAAKWLKYTYGFAIAVMLFAIGSLFFHKIPWLKPESGWEMTQLLSSKLLVFTVLGFMLLMAARNYATHKHNSVVNRHRQNALLTYRSLVEAAAGEGTEDIVLAHAAACIFSPQDTGFAPGKGESSSGPKSILELMTKGASKSGD